MVVGWTPPHQVQGGRANAPSNCAKHMGVFGAISDQTSWILTYGIWSIYLVFHWLSGRQCVFSFIMVMASLPSLQLWALHCCGCGRSTTLLGIKQRPHLFERKSKIVLSIMTQPEITERITQVYSNYCQDGNVFVHASNFRTWQLVCSAASFSDCETRVKP